MRAVPAVVHSHHPSSDLQVSSTETEVTGENEERWSVIWVNQTTITLDGDPFTKKSN
jgi:hypothetical protein